MYPLRCLLYGSSIKKYKPLAAAIIVPIVKFTCIAISMPIKIIPKVREKNIDLSTMQPPVLLFVF